MAVAGGVEVGVISRDMGRVCVGGDLRGGCGVVVGAVADVFMALNILGKFVSRIGRIFQKCFAAGGWWGLGGEFWNIPLTGVGRVALLGLPCTDFPCCF